MSGFPGKGTSWTGQNYLRHRGSFTLGFIWGLLFAEACEDWGKKWTGGDELQWRISHQLANHVH